MSSLINKKVIWIVSPCYNETDNIAELYERIVKVCNAIQKYDFKYLFIDNSSTDDTVEKLKKLAIKDFNIKIIINTRNFGHIRSPYYGLMQSKGDATIYLASDLQDPPELIGDFINKWELGYKIVLATKPSSYDDGLLNLLRKFYYRFLSKISEVPLTNDTTGFGLYDNQVLDVVRSIKDPYPYLRGIICELGFEICIINFKQPNRTKGISKNNLFTLYDIGILGIISHSLVPIRLATLLGFIIGAISMVSAIFYIFAKIIWWDLFPFGIAPIIIILFGMFGVLLLVLGILGEYIGSIHTYLKNRPVVVEKERINF